MLNILLISDATSYLVGILAPLPGLEPEQWAERIVDRILKVKLKTPLVDKAIVETAVKVRNLNYWLIEPQPDSWTI